MTGLDHIASAFSAARAAGRAALMPYCTLGYPDPRASLEVITAIAAAGADLLELGVPFSDPLADGPTIQHSTQVALEQGMTVAGCLDLITTLRARGITQPFLLMGYINPLLAFGVERFIAAAAAAGADGLIIPDLPVEESALAQTACQKAGLALVFLLPPGATPQRARLVASSSTGFLYLISQAGVTGARSQLPAHLREFVASVRRVTSLPLAVGFGISTAEQVQSVGEIADGVIVGSALINAVTAGPDPALAAGQFVRSLRNPV